MAARLVPLALLVLLLGGCSQAGLGASSMPDLPAITLSASVATATELSNAGIQVAASLTGWPAPVVTATQAQAIALQHAAGGSQHGPVAAVGRALGKADDDPGTAVRSVWVVVLGPGGGEALLGPSPSESAIVKQIIVIDDQTGAYLTSLTLSQ